MTKSKKERQKSPNKIFNLTASSAVAFAAMPWARQVKIAFISFTISSGRCRLNGITSR
jgi:hypothetical protein